MPDLVGYVTVIATRSTKDQVENYLIKRLGLSWEVESTLETLLMLL